MGKVQDTDSGLTQRRQAGSAPDIALIIPAQHKPGSHSFPTTAAAVAEWISLNDSRDLEIGLETLLKGLQLSNRLISQPADRVETTNLFAVAVKRKLPHLNRRYLGMDLPYSSCAQTAFEQTTTLLNELAYGYKIALIDTLKRRGPLPRESRIGAIYSAMTLLGESGLRHTQSYRAWPEKSWRDINTLLVLAEHEKADEFTVAGQSEHGYGFPATVKQVYTTLAHFVVSQPEHLTPLQMDSLFTTLATNANRVQLRQEKPLRRNTGLYSVALNSANPPTADRFNHFSSTHKVRYFLLSPINPETAASESAKKHPQLTSDQLHKLNNIWSQSSPRHSARAVKHRSFLCQRGLNDIVASLNILADKNCIANPFSIDWRLLNQNAGGIGLESNNPDECKAGVGDLIAFQVRRSAQQQVICSIGLVRWLHCATKKHLSTGIETVATSVQAAYVGKANTARPSATRIEGLICKEYSTVNGQSLLVLPHNHYRPGETLLVRVNNKDTLMKLVEKTPHTGNVDCFTASVVTFSRSPKKSLTSTV